MIAVALFFDTLQFLFGFIPLASFFLNLLASFAALLTFWLWMTLLGVKFTSGAGGLRTGAALGLGFFMEVVPFPFLNSLPFWTGAIVLTIASARMADQMREKSARVRTTITRAASRRKQPANDNVYRENKSAP